MTPQSSRSATRLKIKLGVRKGQAGWLGYVSEFIAETKTSGLAQQAMERAGMRGIQVVSQQRV